MKSSLLPLFSILTLAVLFGGCEKTPPAPDSSVLFQAVQDNLHALEKKDLDAVMATIHPHAPSFESTRELVGEMFKAVDLKYTLSDLKVLESSPDKARVSFVQKTEKTGGEGQFQDNIVEGIHTLRQDNGKWKIYGTVQTKVTGLDGKPLGGHNVEPSAPAPEPAPSSAPPSDPKPAAPADKAPQ
jgi:ketosteroid isomerase-like protein